MNTQPIKIGRFRIGPIMGIQSLQTLEKIGKPENASDFKSNLPGFNEDDAIFQMIRKHHALSGKWPPSDNIIARFQPLPAIIERVEQRLGMRFGDNISLVDNPLCIGVGENNHITMDYDIAAGRSALTPEDIEAVILHEAAHAKYKDVQHVINLGKWMSYLHLVGTLSEFHCEEPERFAALVTEHFGSADAFRQTLKSIFDAADRALDKVERMPEFTCGSDIDMRQRLDGNPNLSSWLMQVEGPDSIDQEAWSKISVLVGQSKSARRLAQQQMEAAGISMGAWPEFEAPSPADAMQKYQLDIIQREYLTPAMERSKRLNDFAARYMRAAEYRADDTAIIHASDPSHFLRTLQKLPDTEDALHPPIHLRIERGRRLAQRLMEMRQQGNNDIDAAITYANQESDKHLDDAAVSRSKSSPAAFSPAP